MALAQASLIVEILKEIKDLQGETALLAPASPGDLTKRSRRHKWVDGAIKRAKEEEDDAQIAHIPELVIPQDEDDIADDQEKADLAALAELNAFKLRGGGLIKRRRNKKSKRRRNKKSSRRSRRPRSSRTRRSSR